MTGLDSAPGASHVVNMELGDFERDIKATVPATVRRALFGATREDQ